MCGVSFLCRLSIRQRRGKVVEVYDGRKWPVVSLFVYSKLFLLLLLLLFVVVVVIFVVLVVVKGIILAVVVEVLLTHIKRFESVQ